jgi:hypothetical protein
VQVESETTGAPAQKPDPVLEELKQELEDLARDCDSSRHLMNALGQAKLTIAIGDAAVRAIGGGLDRKAFLIACSEIWDQWDAHIKGIVEVRKAKEAESEADPPAPAPTP